MRIKHPKKIVGLAMLLIAAALTFELIRIHDSILQILSEERTRLKDNTAVQYQRTALASHKAKDIRIWQSFTDTRDLADFNGSIFAATDGGLVEYSPDGQVKRHFTVLDGLPESDLTALESFRGRLYIGTRREGLLEYDGKEFHKYVWPKRDAQTVTSLINDSDKALFIGTFNGGLLVFDGGDFVELKPEGRRIKRVTGMSISEGRLAVSTFDNGFWIRDDAAWSHYGKLQGLPSDRVTGTIDKGDRTIAATDLGVAICTKGLCTSAGLLPALTGIARSGGDILVSRDAGEVYKVDKDISKIDGLEDLSSGFRFAHAGGGLYIVGHSGIFEVRGTRLIRFGETQSRTRAGNFSSALLVRRGLVYNGTFRDGIDVLTTGGRFVTHIESDGLSDVNNLAEGSGGSVLAAANEGVFDISGTFSVREAKSVQALPRTAVTQVSGDVLATSKGLLLDPFGSTRLVTAENGLPSNSVYTTLEDGGYTYAGTLGGLAKIRQGRVEKVWKDSNSGLSTNWVTSLASARGRIFIGTYGGGIYELLPSGKIVSFAGEAGKFTVNFNALVSDGKRLYAGTLSGLKVLDLETQKWTSVTSGLPSRTVMAVAVADGRIYAGTTNGVAILENQMFDDKETE